MILSLTTMRRSGEELFAGFPAGSLEERADAWFDSEATRELRRREVGSVDLLRFDIFLSHAFADRRVVAGVYHELTRLGFSVYVDWIYDPNPNRANVNATIAELLRRRMRQCDSLFYLTTSRAQYSKWMPWETGYFDGYDRKTTSGEWSTVIHDGHVAILPVLDGESEISRDAQGNPVFRGQEYLGLYCWVDVRSVATANSRAVDIHNVGAYVPKVDFDAWIGGRWP